MQRKQKFILTLVLVGIIVYFNSLFNPFVWDDLSQIVQNPRVHSIQNIPLFFTRSTFIDVTQGPDQPSGLYYKPLMMSAYSLIYSLFQASPFFYHLFQLVIHLANSILVFLLFVLFLDVPLSFLLALIFLVSPINAESVIYASSFQEVLFFFFGLSALLIAKKFKNLKIKILTFCLLLFSLLSKETGILFLFIFLLFYFLFMKKRLKPAIIIVTLSLIIYSVLRFFVAKIFFEKISQIPIMNASFAERLMTMPSIIFFYLKTFFFPKDLAVSQMWVVKSLNFSDFYLPLLFDLLFLAVIVYLALMLRQSDKKNFIPFCFFLIWFLAGIGFHLQIIPLDFTVSDRWFYFPMVGLLGMIGVSLDKKRNALVLVLLTLIIIVFSLRTIIRNTNWQSALILFSHDAKTSKQNSYLEGLLGHELFLGGRFDEAEYHLNSAIKLNPQDIVTWYNLGVLYEGKGDFDQAKKNYLKFISLKGDSYYAYQNVSDFLLRRYKNVQTTKEAKSILEKGITKYPNKQDLWLYLAVAQYRLGNKEEALKAVKKAESISKNKSTEYIYNQIKK